MKFTNVKQLIIKFMGGGLVNFPTRFLRWVKIDGDAEGDDGGGDDEGGGDTSEEAFLFQVLTIINSTEGFYFDENLEYPNYVYSISDWDDSWAEGATLLGDKETADYVIFGNSADNEIYDIFVTADELSTLKELYYPYKNFYNDWRKNQFAFPIEIGTEIAFNDNTPYIRILISNEQYNKPGCLFDNQEFAHCILFGIERYYMLGPEFNNVHYETVEPKFSFRPGDEGVYDGFVYMNHQRIQLNYTLDQQNAIYNFFDSLIQEAYLASSTEYYDIYIVKLPIHVGSNTNTYIYTPYVVRKQS